MSRRDEDGWRVYYRPDGTPNCRHSEAFGDQIWSETAHESALIPSDKLFAYHAATCSAALELMRKKNNDYAGADGTKPFKNFELCETLGLTKTEVGMVVRLSDKLQRLAHILGGQNMLVKEESLRDTLLDIINYSVLIGAYVGGACGGDKTKT